MKLSVEQIGRARDAEIEFGSTMPWAGAHIDELLEEIDFLRQKARMLDALRQEAETNGLYLPIKIDNVGRALLNAKLVATT